MNDSDNLPEYDFDYDSREDLPVLQDSVTGEPYYLINGRKVWVEL